MSLQEINWSQRRLDSARGMSLIEMLVSVVIIMTLMAAVFPFIFQVQKRFQGNQVVSESNQSARAALEVMSQEIGQAGYNPQFTQNKTSPNAVTANGCTQFMSVNPDIKGISPGDWLSLDSGPTQELLEVFSTSGANDGAGNPVPINAPPNPPSSCIFPAPPAGNWIQAKPEQNHAAGFIISSYKMPYGGGLLYLPDNSLSNGQRLEFWGDINQDGVINYVVYSVSPMVPNITVCIPTVAPGAPCPAGNQYTLNNLYRSITQVPFPSLPTAAAYVKPANNIASPMVEKVLLNAAGNGPTGQPIFSYPNSVVVGVIPNQMTVVGTIVITLCVAVNPRSMETGIVQWYTMATQIRPLNLTSSVNINNSNGSLYLPPTPRSLPMTLPAGYYP